MILAIILALPHVRRLRIVPPWAGMASCWVCLDVWSYDLIKSLEHIIQDTMLTMFTALSCFMLQIRQGAISVNLFWFRDRISDQHLTLALLLFLRFHTRTRCICWKALSMLSIECRFVSSEKKYSGSSIFNTRMLPFLYFHS